MEIITSQINDYISGVSDYKAIIFRGPLGCGKSTIIKKCLSNFPQFKLVEFIYDYDCEETFNEILLNIFSNGLFFTKFILLKDVDVMSIEHKNKLYRLLGKNRKVHLIMTTNSYLIKNSRIIPKHILQINFEMSIKDFADQFNWDHIISKNSLKKIVKESNFDIRQILNYIQAYSVEKQKQKKIFTCDLIYDSKDLVCSSLDHIRMCCTREESFRKRVDNSSYYTSCVVFENYLKMCPDITMKNICLTIDSIVDYDRLYNYYQIIQNHEFSDDLSILGTIRSLNYLINAENKKGDKSIFSKKRKKIVDLNYPKGNLLNGWTIVKDTMKKYEDNLLKLVEKEKKKEEKIEKKKVEKVEKVEKMENKKGRKKNQSVL